VEAAKILPILDWAKTYDRSFLRSDVIAGATVTALIVPKNLGYAEIAGVPIEHGLYAAAAGAILYAIFGTCRQISTGPSSALSAVAGSAVLTAGFSGTEEAEALVAAVAIGAGLIFILMSLLRLGWISQFISRAVITGFLFGAAIDVTTGELSKITGTDGSGDNAWQKFWSWIRELDAIHGTTLLVGGLSLICLFGLRAIAPRVPGALVVVVAGLVASAFLDLGDRGVELVGDVPRGLPSVVIPDLDLVVENAGLIGLASLAIVMIGFSQSAGDARHFAAKHGYRVDVNQESLAQGAANVGAGLVQGIPVSTSLSASSLNDRSGAKSQVASLATGGAVVLTLLVLAPLFSDLPKAVLGAVIIEAVVSGMMDVPELRRLFNVKRSDFWIAIAAIAGVVFAGVLSGVLVGVVLSVFWLLRVVTSPAILPLGRVPGTHVFRDLENHPDGQQIPGALALRLEGALFFVTADSLEDRIHAFVHETEPPVEVVILDCQSVNFIDSQGAEKIDSIVRYLEANRITFKLARVKPRVKVILDRDGVSSRIGEANIHLDVNDAVDAYLEQALR
jgi:sulfate permease, SulP family